MDLDTIAYYITYIKDFFISKGMGETAASIINVAIILLVVAAIVLFVDIVVRKIIVQIFKLFKDKTTDSLDDYLMVSNFPRFVAHFAPLAIVWNLAPFLFADFPKLDTLFTHILHIYLVILSILVFRSILRSIRSYSQTKTKYHDKPLESYAQVLMIFAWGIGIFLIVNDLTDYDIKSLATLGAASAVVLLIFKDTILGFVASIQVSVNDIVRIGDWITFSKFGADGYVTEINLATVRVQNFDNTFTTIPTYSLIADSFQNWRGMQESKGRRIKRSLFIKQNSVQFLTSETLDELKKVQLIAPYLEHREKEITKFNRDIEANRELPLNGKNQTNLGVFRKYADAYLHENPAINKDLFLMVRHLTPTDKGIPLEIFCFSYDKNWENYEHIQADIFDHLIAAIPYFGLELFESPSGVDLAKVSLNSAPTD